MRDDAHCKVREALRANGIVNIIGLSEEIRLKHVHENIAREDIENLVLHVAQLYGAPIEFDVHALTALDLPDAYAADNRNDLEKILGERRQPDVPADLLQVETDQ
ncbi:hypothetical protein FJ987_16945 [Mesorhizobium sp. CU2]|uniref:hypothetical protein n=1 Tax=unclassified Mesorhizobium TaxID=325217 RepID=UPI00112C544F|nr:MULTISPECIES: hypothetical protein [unclassified Mesorhizobium]TPN81972.1 hypothetical protein FJ988_17435 [Mesorhizobium sp. CU3]TPO12409.1 hypothetical protein FJ987_16945 [Mesorhizobium sp. CU2]